VSISPDDACDAVRATHGDFPGDRYVASPVDGTPLVRVVVHDDQNRVLPGAGWLVGPDRKVWTISSNPGIHEPGLSVRLLRAIYDSGLADHVDPDRFSDRMRSLTEARETLVRDVLAEATAGQLNAPNTRRLP